MTTDYRALCVELIAEIDEKAWGISSLPSSIAIDRARAALAEPVIPVKQHVFPTPSQAAECGGPCYEGNYCPEACNCGLYQRSALAEQPVGPTDDELREMFNENDWNYISPETFEDIARTVLARWGNHPAKLNSSPQEAHR